MGSTTIQTPGVGQGIQLPTYKAKVQVGTNSQPIATSTGRSNERSYRDIIATIAEARKNKPATNYTSIPYSVNGPGSTDRTFEVVTGDPNQFYNRNFGQFNEAVKARTGNYLQDIPVEVPSKSKPNAVTVEMPPLRSFADVEQTRDVKGQQKPYTKTGEGRFVNAGENAMNLLTTLPEETAVQVWPLARHTQEYFNDGSGSSEKQVPQEGKNTRAYSIVLRSNGKPMYAPEFTPDSELGKQGVSKRDMVRTFVKTANNLGLKVNAGTLISAGQNVVYEGQDKNGNHMFRGVNWNDPKDVEIFKKTLQGLAEDGFDIWEDSVGAGVEDPVRYPNNYRNMRKPEWYAGIDDALTYQQLKEVNNSVKTETKAKTGREVSIRGEDAHAEPMSADNPASYFQGAGLDGGFCASIGPYNMHAEAAWQRQYDTGFKSGPNVPYGLAGDNDKGQESYENRRGQLYEAAVNCSELPVRTEFHTVIPRGNFNPHDEYMHTVNHNSQPFVNTPEADLHRQRTGEILAMAAQRR